MREIPEGLDALNRQYLKINGRPTEMPTVPEGAVLVGELVRSINMPTFNSCLICDTVDDMRRLYEIYYNGGALQLNWFTTTAFAGLLSEEEVAEWLGHDE